MTRDAKPSLPVMFSRRDRSSSSSITLNDLLSAVYDSHFGHSDPPIAFRLSKESSFGFRCYWPSIRLPLCWSRRIGWPKIPDRIEIKVAEEHPKAFGH